MSTRAGNGPRATSGKTRRSRGSGVVVAVLLVAVATTTIAPGSPAGATPADDSFYQPPSPLPAGVPGDVIRARSSVFTLDPVLRTPVSNVTAWQVLYRSESATGAPIAISGTVLVPTTRWPGPGLRPLVSYAVGTRGLGDECAPSRTLTQGTDYEGVVLAAYLSRGWAVAVTDMEGLGTPGGHTYQVGRAQGLAVINIARAAQRLPGTGLGVDTPLGIGGYSQGGTSAGWAAELAPGYAPELNLKGVFLGGQAADLIQVAEHLDGSAFFAAALMAAIGYDSAYPELDLDAYLNETGRDLVDRNRDVCLVGLDVFDLAGTVFKRVDDLTTTNPLETPVWRSRFAQNKLGSGRPTVPILQTHAQFDQIIPIGQAAALRRSWCNQGVDVTWKVYFLAEHAVGAVRTNVDALAFLADRFANVPVRSNC